MKKPWIVVLTVLIIVFGVGYGLVRMGWNANVLTRDVDETQSQTLEGFDRLEIRSNIATVRLHTDASATAVTAHLNGSVTLLGQDADNLLQVAAEGGTMRVQALVKRPLFFLNVRRMTLDITLPAGYRGDLIGDSSAGGIEVDAPLELKSLDLHSSAGAIRLEGVTVSQTLTLNSSAGAIETGVLTAQNIEIKSSAGPVRLGDVNAKQTLRLNSSAGAVEGGTLSADTIEIKSSAGPVELTGLQTASGTVKSSAGSVTVHNISGSVSLKSSAGPVFADFLTLSGNCDIDSSAGAVEVTLPADVSASLNASSSAGRVTLEGLTIQSQTSEKDEIVGTLGSGGPQLTIHSSAGSVKISGR